MKWSVYDDRGALRAHTLYVEDSAALVALLAYGATIRHKPSGRVVWTEGSEAISASESYDEVARIALERRDAYHGGRVPA